MKRFQETMFVASLILCMMTGITYAQDDFNGFDDLFGEAGNGNDAPQEPVEPVEPEPVAPAQPPQEQDFGFGERVEAVAPEVGDVPREQREREAAEQERQERLRIVARVEEGRRDFRDGERAMSANQWALAVDFFEAALSKFKDVPDLADIRSQAQRNKSDAYYNMARSLYERRREGTDLDRALDFLRQSDAAHPGMDRVGIMRQDIETYRTRVADGREEQRIEDEDRYRDRRNNIRRLLERGRQEMEIGDYDQAKRTFDEVLGYDRYNREALRFLERVAELRWEAIRIERRTSVRETMADGERAWNRPRTVDRRGYQDMRPGDAAPIDRAATELENRMANIRIPEIRFQGAHISDVISFLVQASREADELGVNIIFMDPELTARNGAPTAAAPAAPRGGGGDPFADFMTPAAPARGAAAAPTRAGPIPPISLEVRDVTLLDALQLVTEIAGLYYRIERNVVIIDRKGRGRLVTRFYSVDPTLFTARTGAIGGGGGGARGGGGDDFFGGGGFGGGGGATASEEPDLRAIFERYGVQIPENGEIAYDPLVAQLVVTLTPDQFDQFEEVLRVINVTPRQVQIEARFVEVLQRDLEQLGFEWILRDNYELLVQDGPGPVAGRQRIQMDRNPTGITGGLRFFDFDPVSNQTSPNARTSDQFNPLGDIMSLRGVLTNPELQMVVHAIDQRGNSDLLSAPRVTTINGVNAIIEVVNEIIYPTEFDVTQNDIQVQGGAGAEPGAAPVFIPPTVIPGGFETRQVGVILNVTPTVSADNYTINLTMLPEIAELVDWVQYGTQVPIGDQIFTVNMPQPIFASRNVTTSMIVWDGHTVVMGGLIREDLTTFSDKVPLLGDIPLIGRLFRSEGKRSEKRNLLIFVTASLVDPSGNPVNAGRGSELVTGGSSIQQSGGTIGN
ncbi:MAG: hypothetical protein JJU29_06550 [Verrucomicrobia bacterium]|nr:hypothetical protein [Verrucomicrobiota bacterium]MCH8510324.1 hypothetical protein [Kiritimatiellia bacterium]